MPVKVYVSHDPQGRPDPANQSHEVQTAIDVIKILWHAFHHQQTLYTVIANLRWPSNADLLIISERGMGVLELKHYYNRVSQRDNIWYAGPMPIHAGSDNQKFRNPHEQVQAYTSEIRDLLINDNISWLPGTKENWERFKVSTAVCFTHPDVILDEFLEDIRRYNRPETKEWEIFSVLKPDEIPDWAASLSFGVDVWYQGEFTPARLEPEQIIEIATERFNATEWTEILKLMPTSNPYGYLYVVEDTTYTLTFSLIRDKMIIGRNPTCDLVLPKHYKKTSRQHARITRTIGGVYVEDLKSSNGTYILGNRLHKKWHLKPNQQILLGGDTSSENVCVLEFHYEPKIKVDITVSTRVERGDE